MTRGNPSRPFARRKTIAAHAAPTVLKSPTALQAQAVFPRLLAGLDQRHRGIHLDLDHRRRVRVGRRRADTGTLEASWGARRRVGAGGRQGAEAFLGELNGVGEVEHTGGGERRVLAEAVPRTEVRFDAEPLDGVERVPGRLITTANSAS